MQIIVKRKRIESRPFRLLAGCTLYVRELKSEPGNTEDNTEDYNNKIQKIPRVFNLFNYKHQGLNLRPKLVSAFTDKLFWLTVSRREILFYSILTTLVIGTFKTSNTRALWAQVFDRLSLERR